MHPAHLDALLSVLEKRGDDKKPLFPRPNVPRVYRHFQGIARGGVLPGSMNLILKEAERLGTPLGISDTTLDKLTWLMRNLLLLKLETTATREELWILPQLPELNSRELVFGLERMIDKPKSVCRDFCGALELPGPSEKWLRVRGFFTGERLTTDDLVSEAFRYQMSLPIKTLARVAKVSKDLGQGVQMHLADGMLAKELGGGQGVPGSTWPSSSLDLPAGTRRIVSSSSSHEEQRQDNTTDMSDEGTDYVPEYDGSDLPTTRRKKSTPEQPKGPKKTLEDHPVQKGCEGIGPAPLKIQEIYKNHNPNHSVADGPSKHMSSRKVIETPEPWFHWNYCEQIFDQVFGKGCIVSLGPTMTKIQDYRNNPEKGEDEFLTVDIGVTGVDLELSNPDAVFLLKTLMKNSVNMKKLKDSEGKKLEYVYRQDVPALVLQAWIAYARLFNLQYARPGDLRMIPFLRVAFRRMISGQSLLMPDDILPKMAGFVFRMDYLRRNGKGKFYPNQEWTAIYAVNSKYAAAWQDAKLSDPKITAAMPYMLSVRPFVEPTTSEGLEIKPEPPKPTDRLEQIRRQYGAAAARKKAESDSLGLLGTWDKYSAEEKMDLVLGPAVVAEMKRLEKEVEGDPAAEAVPER